MLDRVAVNGVELEYELQQWPFTADDARRIQQPTLAVLGTASPPMFAERQKLHREATVTVRKRSYGTGASFPTRCEA